MKPAARSALVLPHATRPQPSLVQSGRGAPYAQAKGWAQRGLAATAAAVIWACAAGAGTLALAQSTADSAQTSPLRPQPSAMDAELFYQLLLGELQVRGGDPGAGYSLVLDAARRTQNAQLYRRAMDIALQARSGDAALGAVDAWALAHKDSLDPLRFKLQILLAMNRLDDTPAVVQRMVSLSSPDARDGMVLSVPQTFGRVNDRTRAADVVRNALQPLLKGPQAAAAFTAIGQTALSAGRADDALAALTQARRAQPASPHPMALALALMEQTPQRAAAEATLKAYLDDAGQNDRSTRLNLARVLIDQQRAADALTQLDRLTASADGPAEAWLLKGHAHLRRNQPGPAVETLQRYVQLTDNQSGESAQRGRTQAFLLLAQQAERSKDFAAANRWLDRIENPQEVMAAQMRRASILAAQGQVDEALKLLRETPERLPSDARTKLVAEAQLLRDIKRYEPAYEAFGRAVTRFPDDNDLVYEQAMVAERAGRHDDMERLLRSLIARDPESAHAYNALGYSLAERNVRLQEAKTLIEQAVRLAPEDAYIQDSLAWVEYRLGNRQRALQLLQAAYAKQPDVEIAAHLGEVLWVTGEREQAVRIWREGLLLGNDPQLVLDTMKRFQVTP